MSNEIITFIQEDLMEYLTPKDLQAILKIGQAKLYRLMKEDLSFPQGKRLGPTGNRRWTREDIVAYMGG